MKARLKPKGTLVRRVWCDPCRRWHGARELCSGCILRAAIVEQRRQIEESRRRRVAEEISDAHGWRAETSRLFREASAEGRDLIRRALQQLKDAPGLEHFEIVLAEVG